MRMERCKGAGRLSPQTPGLAPAPAFLSFMTSCAFLCILEPSLSLRSWPWRGWPSSPHGTDAWVALGAQSTWAGGWCRVWPVLASVPWSRLHGGPVLCCFSSGAVELGGTRGCCWGSKPQVSVSGPPALSPAPEVGGGGTSESASPGAARPPRWRVLMSAPPCT